MNTLERGIALFNAETARLKREMEREMSTVKGGKRS